MTKIYMLFLFMLCGCIFNHATAQSRINTITKLGSHNSIFTESAWHKDTLYIMGSSLTDDGITGVIAKYLQDGSLLGHSHLIDSFTDYGTGFWAKGLLIQYDTIYHISSKGYFGSTLYNGSILKMDLDGNLLDEMEFTSYYYPEDDFCSFVDFVKTRSGFFILDYARKSLTDFQSCLIKVDNSFNQEWRKCYGNNSKERPEDLIITSKHNIITLANSTNLDITEMYTGSGKGYYSGYIFEVDSFGILKWEWRSPSKMEAVYAGVLKNDSTLVVASGIGKELCTDSQSNALCFFIWIGGAFELNLNSGNKNWQVSLSGGAYGLMGDSKFLDILPSIEKDGYILCGAGYYEISDCRTDTIDKCWANPGIIAKISLTGDSLWLRKYFGVSDIYESNILFDAEITPDSGYSFVGEAFNPWPGETQGQFGWLLMTDRFGCLVPGCQLISSTEESNEKSALLSSPMKIYPNPTSDFLNVLITTKLPGSAILHLVNASGQEVGNWRAFEEGATYIIPVGHLIPGTYVLVMTDGTSIIGTQQVILI